MRICSYGADFFLPDITGMANFINAPPRSRDYQWDGAPKNLSWATNAIIDPAKSMATVGKAFDSAHT